MSDLDPLFEGVVPALVENMANKITERDSTIAIMAHALTEALRELGRCHDGSPERTATIKQVREALERLTG